MEGRVAAVPHMAAPRMEPPAHARGCYQLGERKCRSPTHDEPGWQECKCTTGVARRAIDKKGRNTPPSSAAEIQATPDVSGQTAMRGGDTARTDVRGQVAAAGRGATRSALSAAAPEAQADCSGRHVRLVERN